MRLLITTQAVDTTDPALSFFLGWIAEFAKHAETVTVLALRVGPHVLPANVTVLPLRTKKKSGRLRTSLRFFGLINASDYDAVFVHMNPEYVALGGLYWRMRGIPVTLWYTHKSVTLTLRLATLLATTICTASKESFRLPTKKLKVLGHGIDTNRFIYKNTVARRSARLVSVGRIAPAKRIEDLVAAVAILVEQGVMATLDLIGARGTDADRAYELKLQEAHARLLGPRSQEELAKLLPEYDLFLHSSTGTGSLDKAPLEAMASGVPVVSSSPAFETMLKPYDLYANGAAELATHAAAYLARVDRESVRQALREQIVAHHSLTSLIPRIVATLRQP